MAKRYRIYELVDNVEVTEYQIHDYRPNTYEKHSATVLVYEPKLWARGEGYGDTVINDFSTLEEAEQYVRSGETILAVYE